MHNNKNNCSNELVWKWIVRLEGMGELTFNRV